MKTHIRIAATLVMLLSLIFPAVAQTSENVLTESGIGPLMLGMRARHIPYKVNGLYSRRDKEKTDGEYVYDLKEYGYSVINVYAGRHDRFVEKIVVSFPDAVAQLQGGEQIKIGAPLSQVMALPGATTVSYDDFEGPVVMVGVFSFKISADFTPETLKKVNSNPALHRVLYQSDFTREAKVTSIGVTYSGSR